MSRLPSPIPNRRRRLSAAFLHVIVLTLAFTPMAALGASPVQDASLRRDTLLNGLQVRSVRAAGDRVSVVCVVRAGAMFDPAGRSGLARMTAELLFAGAGSYTGERIRGEIEDAGASLTVDTTWDATWIEASAPPEKLSVLLDVLSLALTAPKFAPEDVASAKTTFAGRAAAELDDPVGAAERGVARMLYGKHTYGRAIDGDPASIKAIDVADVKQFHQKFYGANTTVLSIAGPTDPVAAMALVKPRFGRYLKRTIVPATFRPPDPAAATRVYVVDRPTPPGADVRIATLAPGRSALTFGATKALAQLTQGTLASKLAGAEGLTVRFDARALQSPFVVGFRVQTAGLADAIAGVAATYEAMRASPPSTAGTRFDETSGASAASIARSGAASDFYVMQKLSPDPWNYQVSDADLRAASQAALSPALTIVVVGNSAEIAAALKDRYQVEPLVLP